MTRRDNPPTSRYRRRLPGARPVRVNVCLSDSEYRTVADASPIPIVIYNLPPATGMDLPADLLVELRIVLG